MPPTAAVIAFQILGYWPVWRWYIARISDSSDEPWGVLALLTALILTAFSKRIALRAEHLYFSLAAILIYICSFPFLPPLLRGVLAVLSLASILSPLVFGVRFHLGLIGLLLLSLPLIASLQFYCGYPLRLLTAQAAAQILNLLSYSITVEGASMLWRGELISVDAPCAGIKMLWSGLYLTFTIACIFGFDAKRTWLSYIIASLSVFIGNILRTTLLFFTESGIIPAPHWMHGLIGVALFAAVAAVIVSSTLRIGKVHRAN